MLFLFRWLGKLDGWLVVRVFLITMLALIGTLFLVPNNTFALPTWAFMASIMCESCWGWTLVTLSGLIAISRVFGPWGRIIGSFVLVCCYIVISVLALASTPQAIIPYVLLLIAQLGLLSALRTAARNASAALHGNGS